MAPPAGTLRVGRYFLALAAILLVLALIVFWPGSRHTPKLGLDLEGGAQIVLKATTLNGQTPSKNSMNQARDIIEQRVNGLGVANAEVVIQGTNEISVSVPGKRADELANVGQAAQLEFRPVIFPPVAPQNSTPTATATATPTGTATGANKSGSSTPAANSSSSATASPHAGSVHRVAAALTSSAAKASATATPSPTASPTPTSTASPSTQLSANPFAGLKFALPTSDTEFNKLTSAQQTQLAGALTKLDCTAERPNDPTKPFAACDDLGLKYLLGPVIVKGTQIKTASAVPPDFTTGNAKWTVQLTLKPSGQTAWAAYTGKHHSNVGTTPSVTSCSASGTPCAEFVSFVLDKKIISTPHNQDTINGANTQISGSFDEKSATDLANKLKYGALPVNFSTLTQQTISASLGKDQLKAGLLAGGIGLALVVIYSLLYYRGLGLVTIASLLVSGALVYGSLVVLGHQIGFTLTLAGIAGFIVAIGITADSFVVFFERIKDEVHEGRSMRVAVPRAWIRARRTILTADVVSFLAAAVLYYFASGDVRGFAFTLGLSTILDLVVVFLFTHPLVSLLSRSKTFGSPRFTGLNAVREGGIAPDIPEPSEPRPQRRVRPPRERAARGSVAVLDEPETVESAPAAPVVEDEPSTAQAPEPEAPTEEAKPRTHTKPAPGSAAERAAERRARMRAEQKGEK